MYILSQFNYCDSLFLNASKLLKNKIQKVQNNCIRFALNIRKYEHISTHRERLGLLNMDNRRTLHSLTMMHKIVKKTAPTYLCCRINRHAEIHSHNTRNRLALTIGNIKSAKKANSFFGCIHKQYNTLSNNTDISHYTTETFKDKCRKHLKTTR